jgi:hypothetical protein
MPAARSAVRRDMPEGKLQVRTRHVATPGFPIWVSRRSAAPSPLEARQAAMGGRICEAEKRVKVDFSRPRQRFFWLWPVPFAALWGRRFSCPGADLNAGKTPPAAAQTQLCT